ncbi:MAG: hypothetical protein IJT81_01025 [Lachnospiraceae bacterium]|nr:hypothetical protein [Lachnospiraceae bacterium]
MKKRLFAVILALVLIFSLTACSQNESTVTGENNTENKEENNEDVSNGEEENFSDFYNNLDYEVFGDNNFAAICPLAAISFNADGEVYVATGNEYKSGDTATMVRVSKAGQIGSVIITYSADYSFNRSEDEEEITINGMKAVKGTYPGSSTWDYIIFTDEYEGFYIENMSAEWLADEDDQLMNILDTSLVLVNYSK